MEFRKILFRKYIVAIGLLSSPSAFLEQLDFIDAPNIRIQVCKFNLYLYIDTVKNFVKRNEERVSLAKDSFKKGYLQCKIDIANSISVPFGHA